MPSQNRQHHLSLISRLIQLATRNTVRLLMAVMFLMSLQTTARCQIQLPLQPDGAPGENVTPDDDDKRFAQVGKGAAGKDQTEAAKGNVSKDEDVEEEDTETNEDEGDPRSRRNLDSIDFRAPINRSKQTAWQKIERAAQGQNWNEALQRLDRFIGPADRPASEDYVIRHADGSLKSARLSIAQLLGNMPENLRVARTRTEATLGKSLLEHAIQENSLRQLNDVAVRFFGTPVGYHAADRLATQLIDRGEFALAANWLKLLLDSDAEIARSVVWQKKTRLILGLTDSSLDPGTQSETLKMLREQFVSSEPEVISQWPLLGGNSRRYAEPEVSSRPIMIRRWEFPTTSNAGLKSTIDQLIADLTYRSVSTIPAGVPILVNGKLICRTFRGIEVVDAASGRHLWTTAESASVERLLGSATPDSRSVADLMPNMTPLLSAAAAVDRTGGPIGQFLFQNAAHGLISSDQKTVYFLEDDPVFTLGRTSIRRVGGGNASPRPESTTSNQLKAYNLESGQPVWQIGGPATGEAFEPPLAGWFFLGAPLPDRGDLFIVAQKENVIRLFCLDPQSGSARWSQQIAFAEEGLERNLNRRLWSVQLATAHGIIVCPTTVGWLVGVDRSTGTLVWSHRYSERRLDGRIGSPQLFRGNQGGIELANEPIGDSWVPSAPIIMGDRVVYTPTEPREEADDTTQFVDCVNVFTGERIWSVPRGQALAVNGSADGETVVTWPQSIAILKADGTVRAEIEFDSEDGLPCGRGVAAKGSFWLPLQKHVLLRFDLQRAKLAERIEVTAGYPALGNLFFYQGLLISHAPEGVTAWELEESLGSRLASIRSAGDSEKADVLAAQLALSRKDYSTAIDILLPRLLANPDTILHQSILSLLMRASAGQVESQPENGLALLEQVRPLFAASGVEGATFELQRRQLQFETLLTLNRLGEAFEALLDLVTSSPAGTMNRVDDPRITVAIDPWLKHQFQNVWVRLSVADQNSLNGRIARLTGQRDETGVSANSTERLATLFSFHPSSLQLARQLADEAIADHRFADAEHWLRQIAESADESQTAAVLLQQLRLRSEYAVADADTQDLVRRLGSEFASTSLPDKTLVSVAMQPLQESLNQTSTTSPTDWGKFTLTGIRTAASQQNTRSPRLIADRPSSRFRIETHRSGTESNRLSFFDRATSKLFWTVSLRSNNSGETVSRQGLAVYQTGQFYPVMSRGVLNMLSVPERRVLWTQPVDELDDARRSSARRGRPLEDIDEWILRRRAGSSDAVPVANSSYLCSRASRSLAVLDARTGELRWRLEPLERSLRIFGTHDTIYLTKPDGTIFAAHNAVDGQHVDPGPFQSQVPESSVVVKVDDHVIVTVARNDDESKPATTLRAQSPATHQELWSHTLSGKLQVRLISNSQLAILAPLGRIKLLDLRVGHLTEFEKIHPLLRVGSPEYTILSDGRILYAILKRDSTADASQPGLPSIRLDGYVIAFDVTSGKQLWTQEVHGQHLVTERLDQLPFLITTSYRSEFIRQPSEIRRIIVLDKRDGKVLLDTHDEPGEAGFHSMIIDTDNRYVDLISKVERYRLKATPAESPAKQ
ncbi:MAG: PQQ-binding-like beta-propeller repeat protein [Rhodopirellula sp.]|nr:PQQ-binding-like beta-propeller repeat protein [Rhodopirellula sp.]